MAPVESAAEYREPTLAHVLEQIGLDLVTVVDAPHGLEVAVSGPAIHELGDPRPPRPGALVLLVGADPEAPGTAAAVAGLSGASAVVVRGTAEQVAALAGEVEAALVALIAPVGWSHLHIQAERALDAADRLPVPPGSTAGDLGGSQVGDLSALVDAIAAVLGRPVAILDVQWRLLAYSTVPGHWIDELQRDVILSRVVPPEHAYPRTRMLLLTGAHALPFHTDTPDGRIFRIGVGILVGGEPLGMMWVLEGVERLPAERLVLVEEYARVAGAHLAQARVARTAARRLRGELVGDVLDGRRSAAACRRLGIDPAAGITVVAIGAGPDEPALDGSALDAVAAYLDAYRRTAACALRDGTVYCIGPHAGAKALFADLVTAIGRGMLAAVGDPVTDADELGRSRRRADLALAALQADPRDRRAVTIEEVRPAAALLELRALLAEHPQLLLHEPVPALAEAAESVLAYVEGHGDVRASAAVLGVHPNTVRYRVRRLAELGVDLTDPTTRLDAWLRLAVSGPAAPAAGACP